MFLINFKSFVLIVITEFPNETISDSIPLYKTSLYIKSFFVIGSNFSFFCLLTNVFVIFSLILIINFSGS